MSIRDLLNTMYNEAIVIIVESERERKIKRKEEKNTRFVVVE